MNNPAMMQLLFPVLLVLIFYFLLIRPQRKREKQVNEMRKALKPGDQITTIGGIFGKIIKVKEDKIVLEVNDKTRIEMAKWAISSVVNEAKETPKMKVEEPIEEAEPAVEEAEESFVEAEKAAEEKQADQEKDN